MNISTVYSQSGAKITILSVSLAIREVAEWRF